MGRYFVLSQNASNQGTLTARKYYDDVLQPVVLPPVNDNMGLNLNARWDNKPAIQLE